MTKTPSAFFRSLFLVLALSGCSGEDESAGSIGITFNHLIGNLPVIYNEMVYQNAAGNPYEIKEIQWFISDVTLVSASGREVVLDEENFCHYIDTNLPTTLQWSPQDNIPTGNYTALRFTFGIKGDKNIPGIFPDLPESNMIWPYALGGDNGGYHYMKLNGFWLNESQQRTPFNFHLGVGQIYNSNHEVTGFVQNWFEVSLPIEFIVHEKEMVRLQLNMNVNGWFDSPFIYDFNSMGGSTMMNQDAMQKIKGNGVQAFTIIKENN